jgi:hypothetical protein
MTSQIYDRRDGLSSAVAVKGPCLVATVANITLSGLQTIDGVVVVTGDRVLVKNQVGSAYNGIYIVDTGDWARSADFSRNDDVVNGTRVVVTGGTQATSYQVSFSDTLEFGATALTFFATPAIDIAGVGYATNGVVTNLNVDGSGNLVRAPAPYLTPEMFLVGGNRIGEGANDDAVLAAWVSACNTLGLEARGTKGVTYVCSSALMLTLKVPFDGCGCEFTVPNSGQSHNVIGNDSLADDIDNTVSLATINTWTTGLRKGSRKIPALASDANKGWQYYLLATDQVFLLRSSGGGGDAKGETFTIVDELGNLDVPMARTFTMPFSAATCQRRRIREQHFFGNFRVRVISGSSSGMSRVVAISRPNTLVKNVIIFNESGQNIQQGFVGFNASKLTWEDCNVFGLGDQSTQYAFNSGYCTVVNYLRCGGGGNRRDIDATGSKYVTVRDCVLPDGAGGHWIEYMDLYNCVLGHRNMNNPNLIHCAGSNIRAIDCHFHLGSGGAGSSETPRCMNMRQDLPEWGGTAAIIGGTITIYDYSNEIETGHTVELMKFGLFDTFNNSGAGYGRDIVQPDCVILKPDIIELIGADSNNTINLVYYGAPTTAANVPNHVVTGGRITIDPGKIINPAGELNGSTPRFQAIFYRGETQKGNDTDVLIRGVKNPRVFCSPQSATILSGHETEGRYNIVVEDAQELASYSLRYGACKSARLRQCKFTTVFSRTGSVSSLKDEAIDWEDFGFSHQGLLLNPFSGVIQRGNGITVADGAYGADGWVALCEAGDTSNVTFSVSTAPADSVPFMGQYLQPDATAKKLGAVAFVDTTDSKAHIGRLLSMVSKLYCSAGISIRYAVLEWASTANAPTRDVINNWASTTYTAGNFFAANYNVLAIDATTLTATTLTNIAALFGHVGSSCANLAVVFWTETALAQNGYLRIAADLYPGFDRPLLRRRGVVEELLRCQAFYQSLGVNANNVSRYVAFRPPLRKPVTVNVSGSNSPAVTNENTIGCDVVTSSASVTVATITVSGEL